MGIEDKVIALRKNRKKQANVVVPERLQDVTKARVREVLSHLQLGDRPDAIDAVFALLDNETPSWFSNAADGTTISSGATTAHIGCHVGILQRGGTAKLDREGRDYWIKPLRAVGAIEAVTLTEGTFVPGHIRPKSSNSAYRLADDFVSLLQAKDDADGHRTLAWLSKDAQRQRLAIRQKVEEMARVAHSSAHSELIDLAVQVYARSFLPDYEVLYVDDGDGERVPTDSVQRLAKAGLALTLKDAFPDVLLWNPATDRLWVIEAVTSDGEVDEGKADALQRFSLRHKKAGINFTTAYRTWKDAARRQGAHRNLAVQTYVWIADDPGRALFVTSFDPPGAIDALPPRRQLPLE